jgi:hypothetical protein
MSSRYNDELDGVPIAYSDDRVLSRTGIVHPYFPLMRVSVAASLLVFRPRTGARVVGTVTKVTDGYIGLIVLGFMNAVVRGSEVRADVQPCRGSGRGSWASVSDPSHRIEVGASVVFIVKEVVRDGAYATIEGSLKRKNTGNAAHASVKAAGDESRGEGKIKASKKEKKDNRKRDKKKRQRGDDAAVLKGKSEEEGGTLDAKKGKEGGRVSEAEGHERNEARKDKKRRTKLS